MSSDDVAAVAARVETVRAEIDAAAARAGREPETVRLVAVTKTVELDRIRAAMHAGVTDLGENRAQELLAKVADLADLAPAWHFVGQLQSNKVRRIAPHVVRIHSVDRRSLVQPLVDHAPHVAMCVQVNVAGEATKGGCPPDEVPALLDALRSAGLRRVDGLMTVPPAGVDPRPFFDQLRDQAADLGLSELSIGMTEDYTTAIEHGATIVRVGRAIFGPRRAPPGVEQYDR